MTSKYQKFAIKKIIDHSRSIIVELNRCRIKNGREDLYVLEKSGGVSLFDGISSKVKLSKKDRWWIITKNAKLEEGLVIAKDLHKDLDGNTHYSVEPDCDMLLDEYIKKLECLKKYMKQKV